MDMPSEVVVGVDVCKDYLDIDSQRRQWRTNNNVLSIEKFINEVQKWGQVFVIVESTGGYENALVEQLWEKGIKVARVNPRRTKAFAVSCGYTAKTDQIDAHCLRMFGEKMHPVETKPLSLEIRQLKRYLDRRVQLITMRTAEKNRLKHPAIDKQIGSTIKKLIKFLTKEVKLMEAKIRELIDGSAELSEIATVLKKEIGVGPVLMMTVLARLPELGTVSRETIAALVGVAPMDDQSGGRDRYRRIKGGRADVRCVLYMATLSAIRKNDKIKKIYIDLVKRGKLKMVAVTAAMRRFIVHLNAVVRDMLVYSKKDGMAILST